jgi:hypothetical protein
MGLKKIASKAFFRKRLKAKREERKLRKRRLQSDIKNAKRTPTSESETRGESEEEARAAMRVSRALELLHEMNESTFRALHEAKENEE